MGKNWPDLFRVDILNCIGASMIVTAFIAAPRKGRPAIAVTLAVAAVAIALGPIVGPAHFPDWLPRPLTSYLGGERPMSWFPIFPWLAWPLIGVAARSLVGARQPRSPRKLALAFLITGVVGFAMTWAVILIRRANPYIIHYPSDVVQQMGPGTFFYRLGYLGPMALGRVPGHPRSGTASGVRFSMMRQFGQTSLLVYWIHVDLCYGLLFARFHHKLSMGEATVGFVAMTLAMLGVSMLKTRYWKGLAAMAPKAPAPRRRRPRTGELTGNLGELSAEFALRSPSFITSGDVVLMTRFFRRASRSGGAVSRWPRLRLPRRKGAQPRRRRPSGTSRSMLERHVAATKAGQPNVQALGALVIDETGRTIFARNPDKERPIASISKLAAVLAVMDKGLELEGLSTINKLDAEVAKGGAKSRLLEGLTLSNRDLLHAALMGSDNRAIPALGRAVKLTPGAADGGDERPGPRSSVSRRPASTSRRGCRRRTSRRRAR